MIGTPDDPIRRHPTVLRVRAMLAERDPELLAAVDDVDRTLIVSELRLDPLARIRSSVETALFLERWSQCSRPKDRLTVPILVATLEEREREKA